MKLLLFLWILFVASLAPGCTKNNRHPPPQDVVSVVEVDERGWLTLYGVPLSYAQLSDVFKEKTSRAGPFPVLIRCTKGASPTTALPIAQLCFDAGVTNITLEFLSQTAEELEKERRKQMGAKPEVLQYR